MRRFAVSGLVAGLALAALAAAAIACLEPRGYLGMSSAGPGEPVPFDITGTDPGAAYTVTAAGQGVASGTDGGGGPGEGTSGSFTMPDLGDEPRAVNVMFSVEHEGSTWQSPESIQYAPPAPAPAPSEPATTGPAAGGPGAETEKKSEGKGARGQPGERPTASPASAPPTASPAPSPSPVSEPVSEPQETASEVAARDEAESSVPDRALDAVGSTTSVGSAEVPTAGLLLMGLIFVAGTALTAYVVWLLQTGPDPKAAIRAPAPLGPDPVEVELQEIIAEEMARKLVTDLNFGRPTEPDGVGGESSQQRR